jgi:diaminohydroxyphosphoribosylaminopyrimidine deaminase/5-amino-6-(5-phosphoribosylamino)uracil reductase
MTKDEKYMNRAMDLALLAQGHTSPNPMVGCVIVKSGRVIAEGYHKKAGLPHAEAEALKKAGKSAKGSTLYVNLEPCSHFGKTPPCADAIIAAGIREVVAAIKDPNPLVAGKGFARLRKAGIKVRIGISSGRAEKLNRIFLKNKTVHMPYVVAKAAVSTDGKMALKNGVSKWITSAQTRDRSQQLRRMCDAILVGINTVIMDDPFLDCRIDAKKKMKKVVFDYMGRMPENGNIYKNSDPLDIYILTVEMNAKKSARLRARGINIITAPGAGERIDENEALKKLFAAGICSVLVEGGGSMITSFLREKLVDEMYLHIAPIIIGSDGIPFAGVFGIDEMAKAIKLGNSTVEMSGPDIILSGTPVYAEGKNV